MTCKRHSWTNSWLLHYFYGNCPEETQIRLRKKCIRPPALLLCLFMLIWIRNISCILLYTYVKWWNNIRSYICNSCNTRNSNIIYDTINTQSCNCFVWRRKHSRFIDNYTSLPGMSVQNLSWATAPPFQQKRSFKTGSGSWQRLPKTVVLYCADIRTQSASISKSPGICKQQKHVWPIEIVEWSASTPITWIPFDGPRLRTVSAFLSWKDW